MNKLVFALIVTGFLVGCASNTGSSRAREMNIRYGEVTRVSRVPVPSAAPAGAIIGGFTGLVLARGSNPGRQAAAGIGGAALGGLATAALEGDRRAYRYHIRFSNGSETDYITENSSFREGDCIAVERREHANLRRVSDALCESAPVTREVVRKRETEANQCHNAKDQVLRAVTEEEIEQAARKVRILCQY
jgi:outer membrane lipoprotein SlyB